MWQGAGNFYGFHSLKQSKVFQSSFVIKTESIYESTFSLTNSELEGSFSGVDSKLSCSSVRIA